MSVARQSILYKLSRARDISDAADLVIKEWADAGVCKIGFYMDRKCRLVWKVEEVVEPPIIYNILISEMAHHLRSSLDHIAFALSNPENPIQEKYIKFPICSKRRIFNNIKSGALVGANQRAVKIIESVQPYHRKRDGARLLAQLQEIDNWCKHKSLPIATSAFITTDHDLSVDKNGSTGDVARQELFRGRIERNKVVSRVVLSGTWEAGSIISGNPSISIMPIFGNDMNYMLSGKGVRGIMTKSLEFIRNDILDTLEEFL